MITYVFEIILLTILGFIYYSIKGKMHNPGYLLMGGFFIVAISYFCSIAIAISIGEIQKPQGNDILNYITEPLYSVLHIWPILAVLTISLFFTFFELPKKERELAIETTLFYKIFFITTTIILSSCLLYTIGVKSKLAILIISVLVKVGLEYYLYPQVFKDFFKIKTKK